MFSSTLILSIYQPAIIITIIAPAPPLTSADDPSFSLCC